MKPGITRFSRLAALGSLLVLAACQSGYQSTKNTKTPAAKASASDKQTGGTYTVKPGDTLFGISFRAGLNYRDVAAWNGIEEPYTIRSGQKLRLSPAKPASGDRKATTLPNVKPAVGKPVVVTAPAVSNIPWQWPAKGELVGRYVADDKTSQGINIAGKPGQKITAAADGVVVYSGAGLIGYGELLIIKHSSEWISAYAHNDKRLVAEGVKVKAGQHIADMGRTGAVRDMLHFEIRRNGKPVDPLLYLPKP
ncbi:MAG TPA: peptidoglycan DD-metalloendopeptidase family protein [Arenimonas sp.]|nr:peptidoglycan DD-metalloendopeptidase family protein [Arenimonas sp.]